MSKVRAALWAVSIGVLGTMLAALLFRLFPATGAVFVLLLIWCVGLVSAVVALAVDLPPRIGAFGGAWGALLVAIVLGVTIAAAPMAPGAERPRFSDLLWAPLFVLLAVTALCSLAGWAGMRAGLRLSRRR